MTDRITITRTLDQAMFDQFASLSGDDNPIHTDSQFSARSRFGRTVAHGVLLCTVVRGLLARLMPPGARLARFDVMYPAPTFAGEQLTFAVWQDEAEPDQPLAMAFEVRRVADKVVTCQGQAWRAE